MENQHVVNLTCTSVGPYCPIADTIYGYYPCVGFNAFFAAFFAALTIVHFALGCSYKTYFLGFVLTAGSISEAIGYAGRLILHSNPYSEMGFSIQISCLIFAPSFIAAGVYIALKQVIEVFDEARRILKPQLYAWVFISCDIVCLVLQAVGGGMAGGAGEDTAKRDLGTNLMIAGIVTQVFTLLVFAGLTIMYLARTWSAWHTVPAVAKEVSRTMKFRLFVVGVSTAYITIFTRCVYRIPELVGGWANPIMRDEVSFVVLEGFMIAIATTAFAAFHPGVCFPVPAERGSDDFSRHISAENCPADLPVTCRGISLESRDAEDERIVCKAA